MTMGMSRELVGSQVGSWLSPAIKLPTRNRRGITVVGTTTHTSDGVASTTCPSYTTPEKGDAILVIAGAHESAGRKAIISCGGLQFTVIGEVLGNSAGYIGASLAFSPDTTARAITGAFEQGTLGRMGFVIYVLRGVDPVRPIAVGRPGVNHGSVTSATVAAVTTDTPGSIVVIGGASHDDNSLSITTSGFTNTALNVAAASGFLGAYKVFTAAGDTGTFTIAEGANGPDTLYSLALALRPE